MSKSESINIITNNKSKRSYIVLLFICILLSGTDLLALNFSGANLRIMYLVLPLLCLFISVKVDKTDVIFLMVFIVLISLSLSVSYLPARSLFSIVVIVLNYITMVALVKEIVIRANITRKKLFDVILVAYRVQIILAIAIYLLGYTERPQLFYYEPSYMALSLSIYLSVIGYYITKNTYKLFDVILATAFLLCSFSANYMLIMLVVLSLYLLRSKPLVCVVAALVVFLCFTAYVYFVNDLNTIVIRSVLSGNADVDSLLLRGGNRMSRFLSAWDVFIDNKWLGVGFNGYEEYSLKHGIVDYSKGISYLNAVGLPPINIYVELLATTGVLGLLGFILFILNVLIRSRSNSFSPFIYAIITMLIMLNVESNISRPYFWLAIGLLYADWYLAKKEKINEVNLNKGTL